MQPGSARARSCTVSALRTATDQTRPGITGNRALPDEEILQESERAAGRFRSGCFTLRSSLNQAHYMMIAAMRTAAAKLVVQLSCA